MKARTCDATQEVIKIDPEMTVMIEFSVKDFKTDYKHVQYTEWFNKTLTFWGDNWKIKK